MHYSGYSNLACEAAVLQPESCANRQQFGMRWLQEYGVDAPEDTLPEARPAANSFWPWVVSTLGHARSAAR